jgi:hypothetical protein
MKSCVERHPKCNVQRPNRDFLPTRLLDVEPDGSNDAGREVPCGVKLVETASGTVRGRYATLSHCWGPPEKAFTRLEKANVQRFLSSGIEWGDVSRNRNFKHAIEVTRQLGLRYLWIDSLCIIQGPDGLQDWHTEAPLMHLVYRNAHVNIAASHSQDRDGGLFFDREGEDIVAPLYRPTRETAFFSRHRSWRVLRRDLWNRDLLKSWLYTRGWVFQGVYSSPLLYSFRPSPAVC